MMICTCIPLFLERAQKTYRLVLEFQTTFLFAFSFCTQDHMFISLTIGISTTQAEAIPPAASIEVGVNSAYALPYGPGALPP